MPAKDRNQAFHKKPEEVKAKIHKKNAESHRKSFTEKSEQDKELIRRKNTIQHKEAYYAKLLTDDAMAVPATTPIWRYKIH